jgi:hypothetical protein
MALSNPRLAALICDAIGADWLTDLDQLRRLEPLAEDRGFRDRWYGVKQANKAEFAGFVRQRTGIAVDPEPLFDVQVKRIHEYRSAPAVSPSARPERRRREPLESKGGPVPTPVTVPSVACRA